MLNELLANPSDRTRVDFIFANQVFGGIFFLEVFPKRTRNVRELGGQGKDERPEGNAYWLLCLLVVVARKKKNSKPAWFTLKKKSEADILCKESLDELEQKHDNLHVSFFFFFYESILCKPKENRLRTKTSPPLPPLEAFPLKKKNNKIKMIFCLGAVPEKNKKKKIHYVIDKKSASWNGLTGFVSESLIRQHLPPPSNDCYIFVCGPPPMMEAISGGKAPDKSQGTLSGILKNMGYTEDNVFKF